MYIRAYMLCHIRAIELNRVETISIKKNWKIQVWEENGAYNKYVEKHLGIISISEIPIIVTKKVN